MTSRTASGAQRREQRESAPFMVDTSLVLNMATSPASTAPESSGDERPRQQQRSSSQEALQQQHAEVVVPPPPPLTHGAVPEAVDTTTPLQFSSPRPLQRNRSFAAASDLTASPAISKAKYVRVDKSNSASSSLFGHVPQHDPPFPIASASGRADDDNVSDVSASRHNAKITVGGGSGGGGNGGGSYPENSMDRTRPPPRLIRRNLPFGQSANQVAIHHKHNVGTLKKWRLLKEDWFHVLLRLNTVVSLIGLLTIWTCVVMIFSGIYMAVDRSYQDTSCGLGEPPEMIEFGAAFAFSLETATTVGYGLPGSTNAFFENCPGLQFIIFVQMCCAMMFNAFLFAFFFARLGKCEARGVQVVFSRKCLLKINEDGRWTLQIRLHDADAKYPIVEAHVRLYVKMKYSQELIPLRITNPNDDMGAVCWISYPTTIVHEIDVDSPLHPLRPMSRFRLGNSSGGGICTSLSDGIYSRQIDGRNGDADYALCPICGESYGTFERLRKHIQYQQLLERKEGLPAVDEMTNTPTHLSIDLKEIPSDDDLPTREEILQNFPQEIVIMLEGIESLVSGTFQALQSYTRDDLKVGGRFAECISCDDKQHSVDFVKFNQILDDDEDYPWKDDDDDEEEEHFPETSSCRQM